MFAEGPMKAQKQTRCTGILADGHSAEKHLPCDKASSTQMGPRLLSCPVDTNPQGALLGGDNTALQHLRVICPGMLSAVPYLAYWFKDMNRLKVRKMNFSSLQKLFICI